MRRLAEFLFEVGMLKRTPRTGYQFLGSGGESVADHSFRTAVIGYVMASKDPEVDSSRVVLMCLFHDFPEARTGDHNYMNKKYTRVDENRAIQDMVGTMPFGADIIALIREFNSCDTKEARLAKDADQLDLILELKEQLDLGNPNARDWISFAVKRIVTQRGKELVDHILETHSTDWWFDKKTDWWVNGPGNEKNGSE